MRRDRDVAVLDSCVLYRSVPRDLLLSLAQAGLFRPRWSFKIHDEWTRNLLRNRRDLTLGQLRATVSKMDQFFGDALVLDRGDDIAIDLPDTKDEHVVRTAVDSNAARIVTYNLKDFPNRLLLDLKISSIHPDVFCALLISKNESLALETFRKRVSKMKEPKVNFKYVLGQLSKADMVRSADLLRGLL